MTLVDGVWHDNVIGKIKDYDGIGSDHLHQFIIGKNSTGIPIVVCQHCNKSRMWVWAFEKDRRDVVETARDKEWNNRKNRITDETDGNRKN